MSTIFVLQHVHTHDDGTEDIKFIGVYSSAANAQAAAARLVRLPGFVGEPSGFHIDPYRVDQDQWAEGFAVVGKCVPSSETRAVGP